MITARRAKERGGYCKTAGRDTGDARPTKAVSGREPEPPRSPGHSGSACGAAGRNANDRFCGASVDETPIDGSTIMGWRRAVKRHAAPHHRTIAPLGVATGLVRAVLIIVGRITDSGKAAGFVTGTL